MPAPEGQRTRMDNTSWVPEMPFGAIPSDPLHNLRKKRKRAGIKAGISGTILELLYLSGTWDNKVFFRIKKKKPNKPPTIKKNTNSISERIFDQIKNSRALVFSFWRKQKHWKYGVSFMPWPHCSFLCACRKPVSSIL